MFASAKPVPRPQLIWCYFCGRPGHETETLIRQDEIGICDRCVGLCARIMNELHWKHHYESWREFAP